jgi:hypothetical protein
MDSILHWDPIGDKIRSIQAENAKAKIEEEKKKKIIYAYWDVRDIVGSYAAVKSEFVTRGLLIPPESYFYPDINMAGGGFSKPSFIPGFPEVITFVPVVDSPPPLLNNNQQIELIRNLARITYEIAGNGTVVPPHTPRIDTATPAYLRPSRPRRRNDILNVKEPDIDETKNGEEEDTGQDWNSPVKSLRDDYTKSINEEGDYEDFIPPAPTRTSIITKGDYADFRPPSTSSSSRSSSSSNDISNDTSNDNDTPKPTQILTGLSDSTRRITIKK